MPANNMNRGRGMAPRSPVSKHDKHSAIRRLLGYVFRYYPAQFLTVILCVLLSSATSVISAYALGNVIVSDYINPSLDAGLSYIGTPNVDIAASSSGFTNNMPFWVAMIVLAAIFLSGIIANYFYNLLMSYIGQGVQRRIRDELFAHMEQLPVSYFDRRGRGDIMSIYTNDVDALREMLSRVLPMVASSLVTMVVCLVFMLMSDFYLTAIVLTFGIVIFVLTRYFSKMSARYFIEQQIELGKMDSYIEEMTSGQRVVKVFNYESRNIEGFKQHNDTFFKDSVKANRFANILMPTVNQLGNIQYALLALVGSLFIANGWTSYYLVGSRVYSVAAIGVIISFLLYSKSFIQPIGQVSQQLNSFALAIAGAARIFAMMDEPTEVDEGYVELCNAKEGPDGNPIECSERTGRWAWKHPHHDGSPTTYRWLQGEVTFDHVDFSYIPGKTVLHDITLYAKPGQKVAFVGPTGAGKTTITNLINRFYDIEDGKVRYDGININKIKKKDLRHSLGIVLQDTRLFTGTIKENIRFGNPDATDEQVVAAAKLANADYFIQHLPQGYDTVLTNAGASLSQGQRQLLAIARAAVADPPVMILDEATSSIDSRTEALVQEGMDRLMKGRTVFVIAHRLSTVQNADVIIVIDAGRIIERGSHEELLAKKGKYYQLYTGNAIAEAE